MASVAAENPINSKSSTFLSELIGAGADAQSNLFRAVFRLSDATANFKKSSILSKFTVRVKNISLPSIGLSTAKLPYKNIVVEKIFPSSDIPKTFRLNLRIDDNFEVYTSLLNTLCVDSLGDYNFDPKKMWTINISTLKDTGVSSQTSTKSWSFINCFLTKIDPVSLSYDGSGPLSVVGTFVYEKVLIF